MKQNKDDTATQNEQETKTKTVEGTNACTATICSDTNPVPEATDNQAAFSAHKKPKSLNKKAIAIAASSALATVAIVGIVAAIIIPQAEHAGAVKLIKEGNYDDAITAFEKLDAKDSEAYIEYCNGFKFMDAEDYANAKTCFEQANIENSSELAAECNARNEAKKAQQWDEFEAELKSIASQLRTSLTGTGFPITVKTTIDQENNSCTIVLSDSEGRLAEIYGQRGRSAFAQIFEGMDGLSKVAKTSAEEHEIGNFETKIILESKGFHLYESVNGAGVAM